MLTADPHHHPWWAVPDEYGALWSRLIDVIGPPGFVGIQDLPPTPGTGTTRAGREARALAREHRREARGR
ncbi:hypothetical protein ACW9HC_32345 [Nocardia gipuzkoensis]